MTARAGRGRLESVLLVSLLATIAMYALGLGFIYAGGVFAPLSDLGAMLAALTLMAAVQEVHRACAPSRPRLNALSRRVGLGGAGVTAAASGALVVLEALGRERLAGLALRMQLSAGLAQGSYFGLVSLLTVRTGRWSRAVAGSAALAAVGYLTGSVLALRGDLTSPALMASFLASLGGFGAWVLLIRSEESRRDLA